MAAAGRGSGTGEEGARGPGHRRTRSGFAKEPLDPITCLFSHPGRRSHVCFLLRLGQRDPGLPDTGTGERKKDYP